MSGFWAMGGYAVFVWGSYAVAAAVLGWNVLAAWRQQRRVRERLRMEAP